MAETRSCDNSAMQASSSRPAHAPDASPTSRPRRVTTFEKLSHLASSSLTMLETQRDRMMMRSRSNSDDEDAEMDAERHGGIRPAAHLITATHIHDRRTISAAC